MADQALMRAVLTHMPYRAIQTADIAKLRIGVAAPELGAGRSSDREFLLQAARDLEAKGASIADFYLPDGFHEAIEGFDAISGYEISRALAYEWFNFPDLLRLTICAPIGYQTVSRSRQESIKQD